MKNLRARLDQLYEFDQLIDTRTPLEFAEDHIPGALNAPVLSNEERVIVGTLYKTSPFEATRLGAAMVARNIAHHLDTLFADRPAGWRPLIYCWRGGKRSGSMSSWFQLIGWKAQQLEGGYKAYRGQVRERLAQLPGQLRWRVLAGETGSGKTRLLQALAEEGEQVLDLEALACHRGSLLGALPGQRQPSQKWFDSQLLDALRRFDPARVVWVEAESKRIGQLQLPTALMQAMQAADCLQLTASPAARVAYLCRDYAHLFDRPDDFKTMLDKLAPLHGNAVIAHWHALIDQAADLDLFTELLASHYDPAYLRSNKRQLSRLAAAPQFSFEPSTDDSRAQAARLLDSLQARP
ncbi:tRNA 2-selenouridine(34) synthase MnmH [Chitinimonas arctica]|uniref:tRNA 2-selenouridine(34) synthase MnmH n=1 Tax=Chitinimonas arctica TaxID=2594795 RepID=A0A516SDE5_9NEIS|nr:tRNA 2-selenouridine(34) synthase MnmH [Chitinimonas arctica]QDQ26164.1 tRNA 2-selenouridine(34) synthase MnmH [Chitinimonas arctica]